MRSVGVFTRVRSRCVWLVEAAMTRTQQDANEAMRVLKASPLTSFQRATAEQFQSAIATPPDKRSPYEHELSADGTGCSLRCPACQYAATGVLSLPIAQSLSYELRAESPEGAISKYRWMEEQAKLPKPGNAPKPPTRWRGTCLACGDWDCEQHN